MGKTKFEGNYKILQNMFPNPLMSKEFPWDYGFFALICTYAMVFLDSFMILETNIINC